MPPDLLRADPGEPWTYTRAVRGHQWEGSKDEGRKAHDFGDELDALAVDRNGRVLVIEAKHGGDTGGIAWTPAQVAVYLRLFMAWVDAVGDDASAETLESMLTQRRRLDLAGDDLPHVSRPLQLVPVIAIGIGSVKNAAEANRRMRLVRMALATADEPLTGLEVLQLGEDGQLCDVGLGGLV